MFVKRHVVHPLLICAVCFTAHSAKAGVVVRVDPVSLSVPVGTPFVVTLYADISDPVVGWGLDLTHTVSGVISQVGSPSIAAPWISAFAPDGDSLAALTTPASPYLGLHSGTNIVLATLNFVASTVGTTDLVPSTTLGDLTEGFAEFPTGFADVTFESGEFTVTPEPASLLLLLAGALVVRRRSLTQRIN